MTEIPFEWLMADMLLLATGMFTAFGWLPLIGGLLKWQSEPPTIKKSVILGVAMFIPITICWVIVEVFII